MPFPTDTRAPWPPTEFTRAYEALAEAATWYQGDPASLGKLYATVNRTTTRVLGGFWSRTVDTLVPTSRQRLHLPAAADIAKSGADMLVGEPPVWSIPSEGKAPSEQRPIQRRLDEILRDNGGNNRLHEAMEVSGALGGVYLVASWDTAVADHPLWELVHADAAVPTFRRGRLTEVIFWRQVGPDDDPQKTWRHLELHEPGRVAHRLYLGTAEAIGRQVNLAEQDATRPLGQGLEVTVQLPDLSPLGGLDVEYVANQRPARRLRADRAAAMWGRSDFEGAESLMDALDETYTALIREIRLAKGRILVPDEYLDQGRAGDGKAFDLDAEVFAPLDLPPGSTDSPAIEPVQFEIRTEQLVGACRELFAQIVNASGYAPQSFGLEIEGPAESGTARRIKERKSVATTRAKWGYWESAAERLAERLLLFDREVFGRSTDVERPNLEPGDVFESDLAEVAQTIALLDSAEAVSDEIKVEMAHPRWTEAERAEEVARIAKRREAERPPEPFGQGGGGQGEGEGGEPE
jgi:hypothetical protein